MSIKIGHASIDEKGNISGGKAGDQTGKEICIRPWYNKPWNVYIECTDPVIADKAAKIMEQICADGNYGYDQGQRLTGYYSIVDNDNKVSGAKGEFDCSSLVSTCYRLAGLKVNISNTTMSIRKNFLAAAGDKFKVYTDPERITSDTYAKRGGIFLSEGHHIAMALENGKGIKTNPYPTPERSIKLGCQGDDVKYVQYEIMKSGITSVKFGDKTKKLTIDGDCGPITDAAIREYQKKHNLTVDGEVGEKTIKSFND